MVTSYLFGLKTLIFPDSFDSVNDLVCIFQSETPRYSNDLKGLHPESIKADTNTNIDLGTNDEMFHEIKFINKDCRKERNVAVKIWKKILRKYHF